MEKICVLIIEDDKEIACLLKKILEQEGYMVSNTYNGLDGLSQAKSGMFQLILMDLMLPYKSGEEILREIRQQSNVPVIVISAKDIVRTKVELLKLGADDYITKPFDIDEVLARIETALRHSVNLPDATKKILKFQDIEMDVDEKTVTVNQIPLTLTAKEYAILKLFLENPNKVFSKDNIFSSIWGEEFYHDDNTINVHVSNIRNKLKTSDSEEEYIETLWGMGYRLVKKK